MASKSITELVKRAEEGDRLKARDSSRRGKEKVNLEKTYGFGAAFGTSVVVGFLDGRFDLSDETAGDGVKVMGVPVVPVAAGLVALGAMAMGGKGGSVIAYSALGAACGWSYKAASLKGLETDISRRAKAGL